MGQDENKGDFIRASLDADFIRAQLRFKLKSLIYAMIFAILMVIHLGLSSAEVWIKVLESLKGLL